MYFSILFDIEFQNSTTCLISFLIGTFVRFLQLLLWHLFGQTTFLLRIYLRGKNILNFSIGKYFSNLRMSFRYVLIHQFPFYFLFKKRNHLVSCQYHQLSTFYVKILITFQILKASSSAIATFFNKLKALTFFVNFLNTCDQ